MTDVTGPGKLLHARFLALGDLSGRSADEIISVVGQPTSISPVGDGGSLVQWQRRGCEMSLIFDGDERFVQILQQHAQYDASTSGCGPVMGVTIGLLIGLAMLIGHWV